MPVLAGTATHCPYCSLQCGIVLAAAPDDDPVRVELQPQATWPTSRGGLCQKGWTAGELLLSPQRLTTPLVRDARELPLRPTSWDDALDRVAAAMARARLDHGPDSVGLFGGGGLTNEKAYQAGKFARVALGSSSIDYNGRFCMSSAAAAATRAFGIDRGLPFPLADVAGADVVLLVGSNPADTLPPAMQFFEEGRARGARHVVVDPRATASARAAHLHLQPVPGSDLVLGNGLLHVLVAEGLVDEEYVASRTVGFEAVRRAVRAYWPDRVERLTGVPVADLRAAARLLGEAPTAMVLTARGAEQHAHGTDTASAFLNLALALGLPGRPFSGWGTVTGQGNGQGGREHGQKADQLPGARSIDDPAARAHVAAVWGVEPDELPGAGVSAYEMLDALGTPRGVRALLVMASNVAVSAPDRDRVLRRLGALDFLAVSDLVLSETAERADVVLPVTQWAEEDGTLTNLEGRVIRRRRAFLPPEGVRTDLEVLASLADRLGRGQFFRTDPEQVFEELRLASAGGVADYAGISYARIDAEQGVFWPCPGPDHPGSPRLFADGFPTPDGRARFRVVHGQEPVEPPDDDYPLVLTTGRVLRHYQSGAQTRRVPTLDRAEPEAFVEVHPAAARRAGVAHGELVRLRSRRGSALLRLRVTDTIRPDTVFVPFHWGGAHAANALTNPALDPVSRMPQFKACAVAVTPVHPTAASRTDPMEES